MNAFLQTSCVPAFLVFPLQERPPNMAKTPNGGARTPHFYEEDGDGKRQLRKISGKVHVNGEIETQFPPELIEEYSSSNQKTDKREERRFIVEIITLVLVLIVAAFSYVQTRESIRSADAAKSAADIANQSLVVGQRAWISVNATTENALVFNSQGAWLPNNVEMKNVGHSPATYVKLWEKLVVGLPPPSDDELESTCAILKKSPTSTETNGWNLFPDQIGTEYEPAFASLKDIEKSLESPNGIPGKVGLNLIVCADYTMAFGPLTHHQTRQVYSILWTDTNNGEALMGAFDPKNPKPIPIFLTLRIGGFID